MQRYRPGSILVGGYERSSLVLQSRVVYMHAHPRRHLIIDTRDTPLNSPLQKGPKSKIHSPTSATEAERVARCCREAHSSTSLAGGFVSLSATAGAASREQPRSTIVMRIIIAANHYCAAAAHFGRRRRRRKEREREIRTPHVRSISSRTANSAGQKKKLPPARRGRCPSWFQTVCRVPRRIRSCLCLSRHCCVCRRRG